MKNYSDITENLDITTKQYVDQGLSSKADVNDIPTSIDGLSGGTLTSPMTLTGGNSATASKIILSSNGQITDSGTATLLGFSGGNYIVGSGSYSTTFRGKQTRPTWNAKDLALYSDIPAAVTEGTVLGWGFTKNTGTVTSVQANGTNFNPDATGKVDLGNLGGVTYTKLVGSVNFTVTPYTNDPYFLDQNAATWSENSTVGNKALTSTTDIGLFIGNSYGMTVNIQGTSYYRTATAQDGSNYGIPGTKILLFSMGDTEFYIYDHCTIVEDTVQAGDGCIIATNLSSGITIADINYFSGDRGIINPGTITDSAIKTNSAVTMYINTDNIINGTKTNGSITLTASSVGSVNYELEIFDTTTEGLFEIINTYKPILTEPTISSWGFTKNKGTVTSVAVKMNDETKGTITSSGTIDLGTVITAHQDISGKLDKTNYEVNKTIDFGSSGVLYVGKFKVYDTNVTCEVTSTTSVTYSGKLVIATQNYVIMQMTVYGDAANTVAPNFFIKPSTTSDPYIEIYFKPASWSKNVIHIYGSAIAAEPTNVCTNVSAVPSTATSKPTNALNSKANLDELTAHINTVATQTTLGHIKMYVEGDTLYLNT